jgi:Fe-S oxidoreductase
VKHLADAVRAGYRIVCSEPSAALCLKEELRHLVGSEDARLVSENTHELMNYLLGLLKQKKLKPVEPGGKKRLLRRYSPRNDEGLGFVYHLPCHLCAVGDETASIRVLQELCGVSIVDLKAGCCGLAGTFGMRKKNYELSSQIAASLKDALEKSPGKNIVTECAACKMQIEHLSDCVVRHPIKILAKAYGALE